MEPPTAVKAFYVFVNALLFASAFFFGALSSNGITRTTVVYGGLSALVVIITKFMSFWSLETEKILNEQNYIRY